MLCKFIEVFAILLFIVWWFTLLIFCTILWLIFQVNLFFCQEFMLTQIWLINYTYVLKFIVFIWKQKVLKDSIDFFIFILIIYFWIHVLCATQKLRILNRSFYYQVCKRFQVVFDEVDKFLLIKFMTQWLSIRESLKVHWVVHQWLHLMKRSLYFID